MADALKRAKQMRAINDTFRSMMPHGSVIISREVGARFSNDQLREIMQRIRHYDAFGPDSDPDEWHDAGRIEYSGMKVVWQNEVWITKHAAPQDDKADQRDARLMIRISLD